MTKNSYHKSRGKFSALELYDFPENSSVCKIGKYGEIFTPEYEYQSYKSRLDMDLYYNVLKMCNG